jgi:hypothetical protein
MFLLLASVIEGDLSFLEACTDTVWVQASGRTPLAVTFRLMQTLLDRWRKMWGLVFLTKNVGSLRDAVHPFLYSVCSDLGLQPWLGCASDQGAWKMDLRLLPVALSRIYWFLNLFHFNLFLWDLLHSHLFFRFYGSTKILPPTFSPLIVRLL